MDERVLNRARLQMILHKHRLIEKEPFTGQKKPEESDGATVVRDYPLAFLLSPHSTRLHVDRHLRRQIVRYLTTCFEILSEAAEVLIPGELEQWGRLRVGNGGDEVHARSYHELRPDGRDAAFVRYQLMVDQDADDASADERLEEESQYGELRHIFVLAIPPKTPNINVHQKKKRYLLLAQIHKAKVETDETDEYKVLWYKAAAEFGLEDEREIWRNRAQDWYSTGMEDQPVIGKLHHLGLLCRDEPGYELRTAYHFVISMIASRPFDTAQEPIQPLFSADTQRARMREANAGPVAQFVLILGLLFTHIQLEDFDTVLARFIERLEIKGPSAVREAE
ncbi:hypothetical protein RSOLAG22IIIB_11487 [Rhizoctonia solani]|uniref:Uncharacterized protein n=1 Tax=Rhizoctonia solani TaxID=456999 RepID=A0A0K6G8I5_9AGAM|nr:hypothetical protein RSOLAG22IIIB_11487 [Rhizoctonia solani]